MTAYRKSYRCPWCEQPAHRRLDDCPALADTADRAAARRRQELRRSNAAAPIPMGQHKRSRSWDRQQLREEYR